MKTDKTIPQAVVQASIDSHIDSPESALLRPGVSNHVQLPTERKFVTVMFADIVDSTALIQSLDPEEAADRLTPVLGVMVEGVHRYGGTVIRSAGDGIVALFGAPHAYEDHAIRACQSAIAMHRNVDELNDVALKIRVALNSGEVMVRPVLRDVSLEYEPSGLTMHVASRIEKFAAPGTICAAGATMRLIEGLVQAKPLGSFPVKGLSEPVELFEITSRPLPPVRWDARLARSLTPLIGRRFEWSGLSRAIELAQAGRGQILEIVGDPGIGKSRLIHEFVHSESALNCRLMIAGTASYARHHPYFLFGNLFRNLFGIDHKDEYSAVRQKVYAALAAAPSPTLPALLPAFESLLGLPAADSKWAEMDRNERRRRMKEAVRDVILSFARQSLVVLILEDLQWIDEESRGALEELVNSIDSTRVLVCLTSRPGAYGIEGSRGARTTIQLRPLEEASAFEVLDHLLGRERELNIVKRRVIDKAQGNPLFLEEIARMLVESAALANVDLRVPGGADAILLQIPATVQSVIAGRIDRLPPVEKEVLQIASVVGVHVPLSVLNRVSNLDATILAKALVALTDAEFLYAVASPDCVYKFKHQLTQEVSYRSLLKDRRRKLHAIVCKGLEDLYAQRIGEHVELLAHHAELGELWQEAFPFLRQSGIKAIERSAYRQAVGFLDRALLALQHLPDSPPIRQLDIDLRLSLRIALGATGDYRRLYEHLTLAERQSAQLHDTTRLCAVYTAKTHVLNVLGDIAEAISSGVRARDLAAAERESGQAVAANYFLAQAHEFHGDYPAAIAILTGDLPRLRKTDRLSRLGMTGTNSVLHLSLLSHSHGYLGDFAEAESCAREACQIAEETCRPFDQGVARFGDGIVKICRGQIDEAIETLDLGLEACRRGEITAVFPMLASRAGFAYAMRGRLDEGANLLNRARVMSVHAAHIHGWCLAFSGWVEHKIGATTTGLSRQREALEIAIRHDYRGMQVWVYWLLGVMLLTERSNLAEEGSAALGHAIQIADALGMNVHSAHCHRALAQFHRKHGRTRNSEEEMNVATQLYRKCGALSWLGVDAFHISES
jgi:class 3 adenylate cyclase/tetratricopeptide (TPR) repeat protein